MHLEHLATAVEADSPHRRYAALHRAVDSGMASDATWRELVDVCLALGHHDEALRAYRRLDGVQVRRDVEALLVHRGLLQPTPLAPAAPDGAPRSSGLREDVGDAARVLLEDHMPLTTVVATLTFPLVVGLGGFLTAGHSFFLFPLIAALPALCVVGIVGALSRGIMVDSAHGIHDVPRIPDLPALVRQAGRFLLDSSVLVGLLAGPAIVMHRMGVALSTCLLAAAVAAILLPMVLLTRQLTNDWRALSPNCVFRAIGRLGRDYFTRAGVSVALFLPAAVAAIATTGSHLYLQISVVGPLLVAPLFVAARLLGGMVEARREVLADLLSLPARRAGSTVTLAAAAVAQHPAPARPAPAPAPAASRPAVAPPARQARPTPRTDAPTPRPAPIRSPSQKPAAARTPTPKAAAPAAAPGARPAAAPPAATVATPARKPAPAVGARAAAPPPAQSVPPVAETLPPDFTTMPGYHIVQGKARVLSGAAASPGSGRHRAQP